MPDVEPDRDSTTGCKLEGRNSCPPRLKPCCGGFRERFHAIDFRLELQPSCSGKPVALLISGFVVQFAWFDPAIFQKAADRSKQCSSAHPDTSIAQSFDILEQCITVSRPVRQTGEYQQDRFRKRLGIDVR